MMMLETPLRTPAPMIAAPPNATICIMGLVMLETLEE